MADILEWYGGMVMVWLRIFSSNLILHKNETIVTILENGGTLNFIYFVIYFETFPVLARKYRFSLEVNRNIEFIKPPVKRKSLAAKIKTSVLCSSTVC